MPRLYGWAAIILGFWFFYQFFEGVMFFGGADISGVAIEANIGGFVAGMLMAMLLPNKRGHQNAHTW